MFCFPGLTTRFLITFLILAAAVLPQASADEWISEQYRCALTIPTSESWTSGIRQSLPSGEVILHAVSMENNQGVMVTFVPEMQSTDLRDPRIERLIQELLILQGWNLESGIEVTWKGRPFLQFIARRKDAISGPMLGVARAAIRAGDLYVVTAYGRGEANRAEDPTFMRVMNTFRFLDRRERNTEKSSGAPHQGYWIALFGSAGAAGLLIAAFAVMIFLTRRGTEVT